jgi:hypothetical protein
MIFRFAFAVAFSIGATSALAETAAYDRVLSAVTLSFGDNGAPDRAVLVDNFDSGADLYIYRDLSDAKTDKPMQPALVKKAVAFNGGMFGSRPSLDTNAKGSLIIKSENDAVGRSRWNQTMTVVFRNHEYLIAGISYAARDTLDPNASGFCDINYLTGKGTRNGKPIEAKFSAIRLIDWTDDKLPKECQF